MKRNKWLTGAIILLAISGCNTDKPKREALNQLPIKEIIIESEVKAEEESKHAFKVNIRYPEWQVQTSVSKQAKEQMIKHIQYYLLAQDETLTTNIKQGIKQFREEYDSLTTHFPNSALFYEFKSHGEIISRDKELTSIRFNTYKYTGGAHGMHWTSFLNLSSKTGKELPIDSLIRDKKTFAASLDHALRKRYNMTDTDNWESFGFFINSFQWPRNIGFTADSIQAVYNPYEIRSYADGTIKIALPRKAFGKQ